jgi:hypothetical protein
VNPANDTGIPFNSRPSNEPFPDGVISIMTPNLIGCIQSSNYGGSSYIVNDAPQIPTPTAGSNIVYMADPRPVTGSISSVWLYAFASAAISMQWAIYDGATSLATGTVSLTTTPKWFQLTSTPVTANSKYQVRFTIASGAGGTAKIKSIVARG